MRFAMRFANDVLSELANNDPDNPSIIINDDGSVEIYGYSEMQETSEQIKERRQVRAEAGRKGAEKRWQNDSNSHSKSHSKPDSKRDGKKMAETETETELKKHSPTESGKKTTTRGAQLHDTWQPTEAHRQLAAERNIDCNLEAEKMRDWARSKGEARKDWNATFRNWLRNAKPTHHPNLDRRAQLMLADRAKYATQEVNQWPPQLTQ